jgi:hypothetical protein
MLVFQNPGLIEIAAVTTMGISVKEGDSPIGRFGTGVKFSIAAILRGGGSIVIWRGLEAFHFATEREEVRGQSFEFVTMNGQRLGFTTQLGRDWLPWMAFRELASNCRDEGGRYWHEAGNETVNPADDQTTIVVLGLDPVWPDRGTILLEGEPLWENEHGRAFEGISEFAFYRGVRIYKLPRPSLFTYDVAGHLDLTEDRTAASFWTLEFRVEKLLGACTDPALIRRALTAGDQFWEHHMDVPSFGSPGEEFRAAARELTLGTETISSLPPKVVEAARQTAAQDLQPGDSIRLDAPRHAMLERATSMLIAAGFDVDSFPIIVAESLGAGIHGLACDGKILLAAAAFDKGTRELAATLLEEFAHLRSGHTDCTRPFQNWLFDQLLIRVERAAGQPF